MELFYIIYNATVIISLFIKLGLCFHYFGISTLLAANIIATVLPSLLCKTFLCYQILEGNNLLYAIIIATVSP